MILGVTATACSRCASEKASGGASTSALGASTGPATECGSKGDDYQPVNFDNDEKYIATHDANDIMDPVWWTGNIYGTVADYERCLSRFSRHQQLMYALLWYTSEVSNGGHHQFFFNSTAIVWPDALAAFEELKLPEGVAILTEANRRMGGAPARDREKRQEQLDDLNPSFDDVDKRLYDFLEKVKIDAVMTSYMRAHAKAFTFRGVAHLPKATLELRKRLGDGVDAAALPSQSGR